MRFKYVKSSQIFRIRMFFPHVFNFCTKVYNSLLHPIKLFLTGILGMKSLYASFNLFQQNFSLNWLWLLQCKLIIINVIIIFRFIIDLKFEILNLFSMSTMAKSCRYYLALTIGIGALTNPPRPYLVLTKLFWHVESNVILYFISTQNSESVLKSLLRVQLNLHQFIFIIVVSDRGMHSSHPQGNRCLGPNGRDPRTRTNLFRCNNHEVFLIP